MRRLRSKSGRGPLAFLSLVLIEVLCLMTLAAVGVIPTGNAAAVSFTATDETKVPHYFGPYSNYANSPLTLPSVAVALTGGGGTGAQATATVGAAGAIVAITITDPGSGYTSAPTVGITGAGTGASATATFTPTGAVTGISILTGGAGYTHPQVTVTGNGSGATATAFGAVDALTLTAAGSGYAVPTLDFDLPDDPNGVQARGHVVCAETDCIPAAPATTVTITGLVLDVAGSGYSAAPGVAILDGTRMDPVNGGTGATATTTLTITSVTMDTIGSLYTSAAATIADTIGTGSGATASAKVEFGAVTGITNLIGGSGYVTSGGIRKFIDPLPGLCDPDTARAAAPACAGTKYIPLAVPDPAWTDGTSTYADADTYEIGLVQYRTSFSSDLPDTLVRGYVQLETPGLLARGVGQSYPLVNEMLDGSTQAVTLNGNQVYAVTPPMYLGPIIAATKDRAVRIVFHNFLPTGVAGNLFLPVDTTVMGAGMAPVDQPAPMDNDTVLDDIRNPMCGEVSNAKSGCYTENRATLHLHGGVTPWISDGTPHQWITPGE